MSKLVNISQAAKILDVSQSSLRNWSNTNQIKTVRTVGGQRRFLLSDFNLDKDNNSNQLFLKDNNNSQKAILLYSRVSSSKQKDDLERQIEYLNVIASQRFQTQKIIIKKDIGSGINFKRPGLLALLELAFEKQIQCVVVASRDRLSRFGVELIEWLLQRNQIELMVLDQDDQTPDEELGKDLMSIVQIYCCRQNGKRRYKYKHESQSLQDKTKSDKIIDKIV